MPELPEVQTVVDGLNKKIKNKIIKSVWTDYNSSFYYGKENIKDPEYFKKFKKEILGKRVLKIKRRAKNIFIFLSGGLVLVVHLKMTGHFLFGDFVFKKNQNKYIPKDKNSALADPFNRFTHFVIVFADGKVLALSDMRKFATVFVLKQELLEKQFLEIGPEPFGLKVKDLDVQKFKNGKIKTVLMNSKFIAGIGNIYSDEILWKVGVSPERKVVNINDKEWQKILNFTEKILKSSIDIGGDSMSDFRNIDGKRGKFQTKHKCYKLEKTVCKKRGCDGILKKIKIGGRVARFCPKHQK